MNNQDAFARAFNILSDFEDKAQPYNLSYKGFPVWLGIREYIYMNLVENLDSKVLFGVGNVFLNRRKAFAYMDLAFRKAKLINKSLILNPKKLERKCLIFGDLVYRRAKISGKSVDIFIDPIKMLDVDDSICGIETISLGSSIDGKEMSPTLKAYDLFLTQGLAFACEKLSTRILRINPAAANFNIDLINENLDSIKLNKDIFLRVLNNFIFCFDFITRYWEYIFEKTKPSLVSGSDWCSRANILKFFVAKKMGIPTVEIMHGVINKYHRGYIYKKLPLDRDLEAFHPDYLVVFGRFFKDLLVREGTLWNEDKILDLGYPWLDYYLNSVTVDKNKLKSDLGISDNSKILVITSQATVSSALKKMLADLTIPDNWVVVVKLHPLEAAMAKETYREFRDMPRIKFVCDKDISFYELLKISNAHAGFYSMALWEAAAFNIPNYIIDYSTKELVADVAKLGLAKISHLGDIFDDDYSPDKKSLDYVFSNLNGNAGESYIDFFKKIRK